MVQEVQREEAQGLIERRAQVVDILPAEEFAEDHLPGAINLPLRKIETDAVHALHPDRPVLVYCWDSA
jgi:rhodanese-related sulfurtransferase